MHSVSKHVNSSHRFTGLVFSLVREGKSPFKKLRCKQGLKIMLVDSRRRGREEEEEKESALTKGAERKAAALRNA